MIPGEAAIRFDNPEVCFAIAREDNIVNCASSQTDEAPLERLYQIAWLIRRTDDKLQQAITSGRLQIVYYSPRGQEVLAAAAMATLNQDDYLVTTYRGIHDQLAKGIPPRDLWAEFAGKIDGACKGKGGPMHMTHPASGVMVTTGIVGSGLPIANGLALASQMSSDGKVTVCTFGDGATNIGAFHEALNLAQLWNLPVIFICQNNGYAEHTSQSLSTCARELTDRGAAYGIEAVQVNGNDPVAMYQATKHAVEKARKGQGPTFLEAKTFRFSGHLLGDDSSYIPAEEMNAAKASDPVPRLRQALVSAIGEEQVSAIEADIDRVVADAHDFALDCDYPKADEVNIDVFEMESTS